MASRQMIEAAIELAKPTHPHPNPRVGAVILGADGRIVGRGAHQRAGEAHAEIIALAEAGDAARGATVYVTLEPCAHQGRTAPCTEALIGAGVERVVIGVGDPDPRLSGRGIARLRQAGIEVQMGPDPAAAEAVDPGYFHHRRTGRPLVTLKLAMTLDGQTAAVDGSSRWITSEPARQDAHRLRARADAVMVGAGTVLADNPRLTARGTADRGRQPRPVLIAGTRPLPAEAEVFSRDPLVYSPRPIELPGEVVILGDGLTVDLAGVVADLGKRDVVDLLVEGGSGLATSLEKEGLVDVYVFYLAASIAGGVGRPAFAGVFARIGDERPVELIDVTRVGTDLRVECVRRRA